MNDYSQNGEGTILNETIRDIEQRGFKVPKVAVEFGAGDGFALSNIRGLMEEGWTGFQLDREPSTNPEVIRMDITAGNVDTAFLCLTIEPIGVVSIDVDGNDYWIWKAMTLKPDIVCIEFNPTLNGSHAIKYDPGHHWTGRDNYFGASFSAIIDLGHRKGYKAIAKTVCNAIFVRSDLWPEEEPKLTHEPIYVWPKRDNEFQEV